MAEKEEKYSNITRAPLIQLNRHGEEISVPAFPESIRIYLDTYRKGNLSFSEKHWHHSVQFNVVLEGTLEASVNGTDIILNEGDGIFINSNVFHCMNPRGRSECVCYSFQVPPSTVCSERDVILYSKYITPVISSDGFSCLFLERGEQKCKRILTCLEEAFNVAQNKEFASELKVKNLLLCAWISIVEQFHESKQLHNKGDRVIGPADGRYLSDPVAAAGAERMKEMLSYIQVHYQEKVNLGEIAKAANVSLSECSRCFHRFLDATPMEYVAQVRIAAACRLFETTNMKPGAIGDRVGFTDQSYFYRVFRKYMGCTPKEYQISIKQERRVEKIVQ